MNEKPKKKVVLPLLIVLVLAGCFGIYLKVSKTKELNSIKTESELYSFYDGSFSEPNEYLMKFLTLPFSLLVHSDDFFYSTPIAYDDYGPYYKGATATTDLASGSNSSSNKSFSSTNIQVENVDEADILKTDGDYLYSISDSDVVITNAKDPDNLKIEARISPLDDSVPEDLIIYQDKLVIIATEYNSSLRSSFYSYRYSNKNNTSVRVYDISDKKNPKLEKNYTLNEPYYTSRRIDNELYVIASGRLRPKDDEAKTISREYLEDSMTKNFSLSDIKYLKDVKSDNLTLISTINLDSPREGVNIDPILIDISNAYVSENAFYLLDYSYGGSGYDYDLKKLFGFGGIIGYIHSIENSYSYKSDYETEIYKFDIKNGGKVEYSAKTKLSGKTINQYSLDEKDSHLRLALSDDDGSYVAILDSNLALIGESNHLAKGETMYSSRFIGDKAYLVTYKNMDPLFVIDLSNEKNPTVLGQLKIPGYSVYLHPYDETHLIGIGIETEEKTQKDENGKVLWTSTVATGMKMALFDVSDFENPKEISKIKIGNARTTSAILSNPKALLFSKEKNLLAIPINNYSDDLELKVSSTALDYLISKYSAIQDNLISEGYLVYDLDLEGGFKEKGIIVHENSSILRGAFIEDNLFVVSDRKITTNALDNLNLKSTLTLINN